MNYLLLIVLMCFVTTVQSFGCLPCSREFRCSPFYQLWIQSLSKIEWGPCRCHIVCGKPTLKRMFQKCGGIHGQCKVGLVCYPKMQICLPSGIGYLIQAKESEKDGYFTNTWAVELHEPAEEEDLNRIAKKHGFILLDKIGSLKNHFHLRHDDVKELHHKHAQEKTDLLMLEKEVKDATQQKYIHRMKRDGIPTDPKFGEMWYLLNSGQTGGPVGVDTNVLPVWKSGITGRGVVISVLDDGLDHTHPDLSPNY
ncbi:PC3-like endoprotease variant B, partial [Paramuricea clavata]